MHARVGDVVGGHYLQLPVGAPHSRAEQHPGEGGGDHGSSLDDGRVVDVSGATCGATQVAREEAEMAAGGGACSLTTV